MTINSTCYSMGVDGVKLVNECRNVPGQIEASSCYTLFWNRTTILRGCQVNLNKEHERFCQDNLNKFCYICSNDTCNNMKLWYEKCYVCNYNCTERLKKTRDQYRAVVMNPKTCDNVSTEERNGCYLQVLAKGEWKQGCVSDMAMDHYKSCLGDKQNCVICTGGSCNNKWKSKAKLLGPLEEVKVIRQSDANREEGWLTGVFLFVVIFMVMN